MAKYFTHYWKNDTWELQRDYLPELLTHTADNRMGHVRPGDVIYPVTVIEGSLFVAGRMVVDALLSTAAAETYLGRAGLWEADYHAVAAETTATPLDLDRQIPDDVVRQLRFVGPEGPRPLVFKAPGRLDQQTLRGIRELTPGAAQLLDQFVILKPGLPEEPDEGSVDEDFEAPEGRERLVEHRRRERSVGLVRRKKAQAEKRDELNCELCEFDFEACYGPLGKGYIEVHHNVPLASLAEGSRTRLADLVLVCSNCHRMLHRGNEVLTLDELAAIVVAVHGESEEDE